ncbi:unnamed protein product [Brachionus calyciflorus]|uniref:VWFD domain-containing protein n=1 Tax=Brachionus calyciflorus TaxID=104777 RepID=A0A813SVC6_9BILA|nr:unnamed protein product [Brachionus calyciflorus]
MKFFILTLSLALTLGLLKAQVCKIEFDPRITTFDQTKYRIDTIGDHFVMYDDFKGNRITTSFEPCQNGSRNCAIYIKKDRKLVFVDFCNVENESSPTSELYGVSLDKDSLGLKSIKNSIDIPWINPSNIKDSQAWNNFDTFLGNFKIARILGPTHSDHFVVRTVEDNFQDSLVVQFDLNNRKINSISIYPPEKNFNRTGGLCGRWNGKKNEDLYALDKHGLEEFLDAQQDASLKNATKFWKLNSVYHLDSGVKYKRCPECMLISERSFYCPCDNFDLFDENFHLGKNRTSYCNIPMASCIEKYNNFIPNVFNQSTSVLVTSTQSVFNESFTTLDVTTLNPIITTIAPIDPVEQCWDSFMQNVPLFTVLNNSCLSPNVSVNNCIEDLNITQDLSVIDSHIQSSIDIAILNTLSGNENCNVNHLELMCKNNCSNNGVCEIKKECLIPGIIIEEDCSRPIRCICDDSYGGSDCSLNLSDIADFSLNKRFCDLRTEDCSLIKGFGYPFSTTDPIYVKIQYTEFDENGSPHSIKEHSIAKSVTDNHIDIGLKNLHKLNLFKSIYNIPTTFKSNETLAYAQIFISYSNESFVQSGEVILYDSKCRILNEAMNELVFIDDKCEIWGVCYNRNETYGANDLFYCNPDYNIYDWTIKPTPDPLCNGQNEWTEWYSHDTPDGDGDLELYSLFTYGCKNPSFVEVQSVSGIPANQTGQVFHIIPDIGFMCFNEQNVYGCLDYQIRQCCPILTTSSSTKRTTLFTTYLNEISTNEHTEITTNDLFQITTEQDFNFETETTTNINKTTQEPTFIGETSSASTSVEESTQEPTFIVETSSASTSVEQSTQEPTFGQCKYFLSRGTNYPFFVLKEGSDSSFNSLRFELKTNDTNCHYEHVTRFHIISYSGTASENVDYVGLNQWVNVHLSSNKSSFFHLNIHVNDDSIIEPYEFFVLEISNVSSSILPENLIIPRKLYIYIVDNDFNHGVKDSTVYDIFDPEIAEPDFYAAFFKDKNLTDIYPVPDNQALFTNQGGFSVQRPTINIVVQYYGVLFYKLHTIEINNPSSCNIERFTIRRKNEKNVYLDPYDLISFSVDGVPIVDIDFYKTVYNLGNDADVLDIMEIRVLSTKNGSNISQCEFRAFGEEI